MKNTSRKGSLDALSRREREIINAVFATGNRASSEEIRARLTNPPTSSAVRAMLARLEAKGVSATSSVPYEFSATVPGGGTVEAKGTIGPMAQQSELKTVAQLCSETELAAR